MISIAMVDCLHMGKDDIITNFTLLEYPFIHEGITHREFEEEQIYFAKHYEDYKKETYIPLWKQKAQNERK